MNTENDTKHAAEPWPADPRFRLAEDCAGLSLADYRRARQCVNACAKIPDLPTFQDRAAHVLERVQSGEEFTADNLLEEVEACLALMAGKLPDDGGEAETVTIPAATLKLARESLEVLIGHVAHYAAMPHAHSDAHRDAANARVTLTALGKA